MLIQFEENFSLPLEDVFPYFRDPGNWIKLYGEAAPIKKDSRDWYIIPLKKFPFPLKAKVFHFEEGKKVRWHFGGFWRGVAEIEFQSRVGTDGRTETQVSGFEYIVPLGFWFAEQLVSQMFMQKEFERIWSLGWKRLRKIDKSPNRGLSN